MAGAGDWVSTFRPIAVVDLSACTSNEQPHLPAQDNLDANALWIALQGLGMSQRFSPSQPIVHGATPSAYALEVVYRNLELGSGGFKTITGHRYGPLQAIPRGLEIAYQNVRCRSSRKTSFITFGTSLSSDILITIVNFAAKEGWEGSLCLPSFNLHLAL